MRYITNMLHYTLHYMTLHDSTWHDIHTYIHPVLMSVPICMHACMCVCAGVYACMHACTYACIMHVCLCIYIYTPTHTHTYIYIYMRACFRPDSRLPVSWAKARQRAPGSSPWATGLASISPSEILLITALDRRPKASRRKRLEHLRSVLVTCRTRFGVRCQR